MSPASPDQPLAGPFPLDALARRALEELGGVMAGLPGEGAGEFVREVRAARRVALYGVGREGLVMRALAMRLYHAGLRAFMVGDMAAEPVGPGDLLMVSAGPGFFSTVGALMGVARAAGARTLVFSADPRGEAASRADVSLLLPAQTMHQTIQAQVGSASQSGTPSVLPMGSLYELSLRLLGDLLIEALKQAEGLDPREMQARHANLE